MQCPNEGLLHDPSAVTGGSCATICVHNPAGLKAPKLFVRAMYAELPTAPKNARYLQLAFRYIEMLAFAELTPVLEPIHKKKNSQGEVTQMSNYKVMQRSDAKIGPEGIDQIPILGKTRQDSNGHLFDEPVVVVWWLKDARGRGKSLCVRREFDDATMERMTQSWNSSDWKNAELAEVIQPEKRMKALKRIADDEYEKRHGRSRAWGY